MANPIDFKALLREERQKLRNQLSVPNQSELKEVESSKKQGKSVFTSEEMHKETERLRESLKGINVIDISLASYKIGDIPSVFYIPDFITQDIHDSILSLINYRDSEWTTLKTRKLQCWGPSFVGEESKDLPAWLNSFIDVLVDRHIFTTSDRPNHVLINQYSSNQGIMHHVDGPRYNSRVAIISLESSCVMTFRRKLSPEQIGSQECRDVFSVLLQPRSLLLFCDEVYNDFMHGITDDSVQLIGQADVEWLNRPLGQHGVFEIVRDQRTSLTIRKLYV